MRRYYRCSADAFVGAGGQRRSPRTVRRGTAPPFLMACGSRFVPLPLSLIISFPICCSALLDGVCGHTHRPPFPPWLQSRVKTASSLPAKTMIWIHTPTRRICSLGQLVSSVCLFSSNKTHAHTHTTAHIHTRTELVDKVKMGLQQFIFLSFEFTSKFKLKRTHLQCERFHFMLMHQWIFVILIKNTQLSRWDRWISGKFFFV